MAWTLDPTHSQIQFAVKHMGISTVRGTFGTFSGTITTTDGQVTGAEVTIDVASIHTGNEQRDGHLKSPEFFDVAQFPSASFALTSFQRSGDAVTAVGTLTLHGTSRPVTLTGEVGGPAKDPWGQEKVSAELTGKISRADFGLTWNVALEAGGFLVSDEVKLAVDVQAVKA